MEHGISGHPCHPTLTGYADGPRCSMGGHFSMPVPTNFTVNHAVSGSELGWPAVG